MWSCLFVHIHIIRALVTNNNLFGIVVKVNQPAHTIFSPTNKWLASQNLPRPPTPQRQRRQAMATGAATKSTVKRGKKSIVKPSPQVQQQRRDRKEGVATTIRELY
jgi:hypothetical protein